MALVIDRLGPGDLEAALRLSTQAGWNQTAADWRRLFDLSPEGCLAGRMDGAVVATATLASFGRDVHWIGMVLVDEAMRGRGFGSTMLSQIIELAKSRGGVVGLDATDLGRPVYLKQGFVDVAPIDRWTGVLTGLATVPQDGGLTGISGLDQLASLDRAMCGADRSDLLQHLIQENGVTTVASYSKGLSGFAFLRPGRNQFHVGPIVAKEGTDLLALLWWVSHYAKGSRVMVDSIRSPGTSCILEQSGLTVARRLTRMTLGTPQHVLMGDAVRAAVSFEWG